MSLDSNNALLKDASVLTKGSFVSTTRIAIMDMCAKESASNQTRIFAQALWNAERVNGVLTVFALISDQCKTAKLFTRQRKLTFFFVNL